METVAEAVAEAVARAICSACGERPDWAGEELDHKQRWQDYVDVAHAAIAAMVGAGALVLLDSPVGADVDARAE